eukprot:CAMPEP_0202913940 /NCGR_PEP_ID=MMETSP1392-20130828/61862_1 /ASSEMBLY_ACC=CAM_ASM_000868 /TAXON_ID=225041 /ORGANISM="Chlamydomonas chlamydogama, Strain SAG 11-48b" /LENGTH=30 /DNA_ID= /DNA_START= /DNA_END= /DNA_ORIENTATION=
MEAPCSAPAPGTSSHTCRSDMPPSAHVLMA